MPKLGLILKDTAIVVAIVAIILVGVEVALRLVAPQRLSTEFVDGITLGMEHADIGHLNNPNAIAKVSGPEYSVEYKISSQGFRDQNTYAPTAPGGKFRILLVGDSFTFGVGQDYENIWPVLLENSLVGEGQDVELIKAGVPGFDTHQEVQNIARLASEFQPDLVMLGFVTHDLFTNRANTSKGSEAKNVLSALKSDKKSKLHTVVLAKRIALSMDRLYLRLYFSTARKTYFETPPSDLLLSQMKVTQDLLQEAKDSCDQAGCKMAVVSIPQQSQVLARRLLDDDAGIDPDYIDEQMADFASEADFHWIKTLDMLAQRNDETGQNLFFRLDGHLNRAGNAELANFVYPIVSDLINEGG